jgi:hypothetical protein
MSKYISPNNREALTTNSSITGSDEYLKSTNGALNVTGSFIPSGTGDVNIVEVGGNAVTTTVPVSGTFYQVTQPVSIADGSDIAEGSTADAVVAAGATGTVSAKLRRVTTDLGTINTSASTIAGVVTSNRAAVNPISGQAGVSANAGTVDATTQRVVQSNGAGKTLLSTGGSASSSGNNTLVSAGTGRLKVYAFSLTTTSATAVTCIFQSGTGGTELWRVVLQAPTSVSVGANLAVTPPAWLFATASATLLNLNLSVAQTVNWSVSYYDEA